MPDVTPAHAQRTPLAELPTDSAGNVLVPRRLDFPSPAAHIMYLHGNLRTSHERHNHFMTASSSPYN